ncbi:MAG TPA: alpha-amylase family glycosyl hydrolase [Polyangiaceae bacterium]
MVSVRSVAAGTRSVAGALSLAALASCAAPATPARANAPSSPADAASFDWRRRPIYLAMTDRFANGDARNDDAGQPGCHDPSSPDLFHGGDVAGLRAHVAYLAELGAGALWVTPLPAQVPLRSGACGYHGYWADLTDPDDGRMEPKLGTVDDVRALVADLHARGIRFVADMVVNHAGRGARIVAEHPAWFHDDATCAALGATEGRPADPVVNCSLHGLPDFAEEDPVVASYLTGLSRRWVERVGPDGIRLDTAKHVPARYLATSFVPGVRSARSDLFLLAEYFDADDVAHVRPVLDAGFDSAFHFPLHAALVDAFAKGGSVDAVASAVAATYGALGEDRALRLVTFLDNHDVPRFLSEAPPDTPADLLARRYAVALAALFTLPGIPQLYQGDELAMLGAHGQNRADMPAWAWTAEGRAGAHDGFAGDAAATWALVERLARLRAAEEGLWRGSFVELLRQGVHGNVLAYLRGDVLVVLSNDASSVTVPLRFGALAPWPDGTVLREMLGLGAPATLAVARGKATVALPPLTAAVYVEAARPATGPARPAADARTPATEAH